MENIEISDKFAVQMRGITKIFNNHRALDFVNYAEIRKLY